MLFVEKRMLKKLKILGMIKLYILRNIVLSKGVSEIGVSEKIDSKVWKIKGY